MDTEISHAAEILEYLKLDGRAEDSSMVYGIIKKAVDKGVDSLTWKQRYHYDNSEFASAMNMVCKRMGCQILECEIVGALDNGGYCSWCAKMMENDDYGHYQPK